MPLMLRVSPWTSDRKVKGEDRAAAPQRREGGRLGGQPPCCVSRALSGANPFAPTSRQCAAALFGRKIAQTLTMVSAETAGGGVADNNARDSRRTEHADSARSELGEFVNHPGAKRSAAPELGCAVRTRGGASLYPGVGDTGLTPERLRLDCPTS